MRAESTPLKSLSKIMFAEARERLSASSVLMTRALSANRTPLKPMAQDCVYCGPSSAGAANAPARASSTASTCDVSSSSTSSRAKRADPSAGSSCAPWAA